MSRGIQGTQALEVTRKRYLTAHVEAYYLLETRSKVQTMEATRGRVVEPSGEPHPSQGQNQVQRPEQRAGMERKGLRKHPKQGRLSPKPSWQLEVHC